MNVIECRLRFQYLKFPLMCRKMTVNVTKRDKFWIIFWNVPCGFTLGRKAHHDGFLKMFTIKKQYLVWTYYIDHEKHIKYACTCNRAVLMILWSIKVSPSHNHYSENWKKMSEAHIRRYYLAFINGNKSWYRMLTYVPYTSISDLYLHPKELKWSDFVWK